jgi:hypothetical protein
MARLPLRNRLVAGFVMASLAVLGAAATVSAHPHTVGEKEIAKGQNHPPFVGGTSCESFGGTFGPAWYGLESAHHGPDAGDPGKADGCYQTTGNVPPGQDDENPAID